MSNSKDARDKHIYTIEDNNSRLLQLVWDWGLQARARCIRVSARKTSSKLQSIRIPYALHCSTQVARAKFGLVDEGVLMHMSMHEETAIPKPSNGEGIKESCSTRCSILDSRCNRLRALM